MPETRNSIDVFDILNARRGLPVTEMPAQAAASAENGSRWPIWRKGCSRSRRPAGGSAGRSARVVLDRSAYGKLADGPRSMTGPALLIMLLGLAAATIFAPNGGSLPAYLERLGGWLLGLWCRHRGASAGAVGRAIPEPCAVGFGATAIS